MMIIIIVVNFNTGKGYLMYFFKIKIVHTVLLQKKSLNASQQICTRADVAGKEILSD